jgi:Ricin-type beta-trefoil lectin domain
LAEAPTRAEVGKSIQQNRDLLRKLGLLRPEALTTAGTPALTARQRSRLALYDVAFSVGHRAHHDEPVRALGAADSGDSAVNDTPITIASCDTSPGQDWTVTSTGTLQVNGKCLDIYRDQTTSKAPVELWTCTGGANQQWRATAVGTLLNPVSGKCLDDPRYSTTPGTQLELYTCTGGANQQWKLP